MSLLYLRHNMGLGDHIYCFGLVLELLKEHKKIILACKPYNRGTVEFMYRNHNVGFLPQQKMPRNTMDVGLVRRRFTKPLDVTFYERAGVNFEKRLQHPKRDKDRENKLYEKINPKKPYTIIHEDTERDMIIRDEYKKGNVIYINKGITDNIYDWCRLIEEAEGVHCIESSIIWMIDYLKLRKVNAHRYARKLTEIDKLTYMNVNIIE